jgi:anti-anti-sigma factor
MDLTYEDLEDGVRRISLAGRMDVEGAREVDLKFTSLTASRQAFVIIDLTLVDFLSSLGLGTLVRSANVIHYAYADRGDHEIRIALEMEGEELRATVEDDGRPFNPLEKEPPRSPLRSKRPE